MTLGRAGECRCRGRRALLGLLLILSARTPAVAQEPGEAEDTCVSVATDHRHWSADALRRFQALGALREYLPYQRTTALCEVQMLLEETIRQSEDRSVAEVATGLRARFESEYPGLLSWRRTGETALHVSVGIGGSYRSGAAAPGIGEFEPHRTGALPLADRTLASFGLDLGILAGRRAALRAAPTADRDGARFEVLEGVLGLGPVLLTVGRGEIGFGAAEGGGIVLGHGRFDRVQLSSRGSWEARGLVRPLRRVGFMTFLTRLEEERHVHSPYFWGATASLQPHWRTTFFVHRGVMVRSDGEFPLTARAIGSLLIGDVAGGGLENQVVSVEGRVHLPTESIVPLTAYLEWGAEDAAGAWWDVPARIIGVQAPALPGLPAGSLGVERTSYAVTCCYNPMWYRHWSFTGSWVANDRPLGHPIGGNGTEWLAYAGLDVGAALRIDLRGYHRSRGPDNLYVPGREGESWGTSGRLQWWTSWGGTAFAEFEVERGSGWSEERAAVGGRWVLRRQ